MVETLGLEALSFLVLLQNFFNRPGFLSLLDLDVFGQQGVGTVQAVDQPGVEQFIQVPWNYFNAGLYNFIMLPEDHSPLVNTVEF